MDNGCVVILGVIVVVAVAVAIGKSVSRSRRATAIQATYGRREALFSAVNSLARTASPEELIARFGQTAQELGADAFDIGNVYGRLAWSLIESDAFLDEREDRVLHLLRERFNLGVSEGIT